MPVPTFAELKRWADRYVELWNAGDKDAWAANWRSVAPGDFCMVDPVGTPEKHGFEACALDSFDLFQESVEFRIADGTLMICGNEVAWCLENHIRTKSGDKRVGYSIETYRFDADGSVLIRTYYRVPSHGDADLGEHYQQYLPEGD